MCCDGWNNEEEVNGTCPECGQPTVDGEASVGCNYSPIVCDTCGWAPCDDSC